LKLKASNSSLRTHFLGASVLAVLLGCQSNPVEATSDSAKATSTAGTAVKPGPNSPTPAGPNAITWKAPAAFATADKGPMRLASYKFAKAAGDADDADLSVTQVGGDMNSNIARWKGQFDPPAEADIAERTVGDLKVTIVNMGGTYKGMAMPGAGAAGPKEGYALLAAIVSWEGHGDPYFFKLTGPKATVDAARPAFEELVTSLTHP
jgi:hypothetical protein